MQFNNKNIFQANYKPFPRSDNQQAQNPFYKPKQQAKHTYQPNEQTSSSLQKPQYVQPNRYRNGIKQEGQEQRDVNNTFTSKSHQHLFQHKNSHPSKKPAQFYQNNSLQMRKAPPKPHPLSDNNLKYQSSAQLPENPEKNSHSQPHKKHTMSCGHLFQADTLHQIIKSPQNQKSHKLRCPYTLAQGVRCNQAWDFGSIKKLQILAKQQLVQLQEKLTANLLNKISKRCPKCNHTIYKKMQPKNNRIVCQQCKFGEFCYLCLRKWKQIPQLEITNVDWDTLAESRQYFQVKSLYCGDKECYARNYELKQNPHRQFRLIERSSSVRNKIVRVLKPELKACPICGIINENKSDLKHVECRVCTQQFCWICLKHPTNDVWPCGKASEYCWSN